MSFFSALGSTIWRDYETNGVPSSGPHNILKSDMRAWMTTVEQSITVGGAAGDGATDDSAAINAAITALAAFGGGIAKLGPGTFYIPSGLVMGTPSTQNVTLQGSGRTATYLFTKADVNVVNVGVSGQCYIRDLSLFGKGSSPFPDSSTFATPVNDACVFNGAGGGIRDVQIFGGAHPLSVGSTAIDSVFFNVETREALGTTLPANTYVNGASWFYRCKWDQSPTAVANTTNAPIPAWSGTTGYVAGNSVTTGGYILTCQTGGTSGSSAPTLKNYGVNIVDGSVTWRLAGVAGMSGLYIDSLSGECHFDQVDLSATGGIYTNSFTMAGGAGSLIVFSNSVISSPCSITGGKLIAIHGSEMGGLVTVANAFTGEAAFLNNFNNASSGWGISIGTGCSLYSADNNSYGGGAGLTVSAGVPSKDRGGTAANTAAPAGMIGELISSTVPQGSHVSLSSGGTSNITSIVLSPGDWDVWGVVQFDGGATTTVTYIAGGIGTTSGSFNQLSAGFCQHTCAGQTAFNQAFNVNTCVISPFRVSIAVATTYYLMASAGFATSTCNGYGALNARRRR